MSSEKMQAMEEQEIAVADLARGVVADPSDTGLQTRFGDLAKYFICQQVTQNTNDIKQAVQICLDQGNVNSMAFINLWTSLLWLDQRFMSLAIPAQEIYARNEMLNVSPEALTGALNDPFLLAGLKYFMVANLVYERFFVTLRKYFLYADTYAPENFLPFLCALAEQCSMNEYVYACSEEEKSTADALANNLDLESGDDAKIMADIALIGCYRPLSKLEQARDIENFTTAAQNDDFTSLVRTQITEPARLKNHYGDIPSLVPIKNAVSSAVAKQYEENPYPRWRHIDFPDISDAQKEKSRGKNILVAGCATGQVPMNMAIQHPEAQVLGIDLSVASVAYGKYKAEELGIANISFVQGDILDLDQLDQDFDLIICVGVLHHMEDPVAGWKKLLSRLKPGGVMKVALYSERARQAIALCREWIAEQGLQASQEGISTFRQAVMSWPDSDPRKRVLGAVDFFSTSMCRDLVFHVQEHRFTLPQIKTILDELGLDLITMEIHSAADKAAYQSMFPDDTGIRNLDTLDAFEQNNPDTFRTMYTFWVRRDDDADSTALPNWIYKT